MKGIRRGRYTKEFQEEAVKLVTEENMSLPEANRRLSLAPLTIATWVKAYKTGRLGESCVAQRQNAAASDRNRDGAGPDEEGVGRSEDGAIY